MHWIIWYTSIIENERGIPYEKCKILHINDGTAKVITNGDRHFVEEHPWAEDLIEGYLNQGYEVKQMIPNYTPNVQKNGEYSFFIGGFTVYMEKEV